jgi:hypothetical protein
MVTQSGLAMVHAGEQITPAQSTGPYTGAKAGGGGGVTVNFTHVGSIRYADMKKSANLIARLVSEQMHQNPSMT